ncbi:hypothetical protein JHK87_026561 [Glycine soja]|nr:hypothetical protein JHK87_026561 [Glycine soja]
MTEVEALKEIKRKNRKKLSKDVFNCFCRLDGSCDSELIKVGYSFAPIICVWFAFIGGIGVYNFIKYDPTVVKAINLKNIVDYFRRNKKDALISLGGVVLAITGTEALFADAGHFTVRSIQISMCSVIYPALILAYTGQASFLRKNNELLTYSAQPIELNPFDPPIIVQDSQSYPLYWPMFVIAIMASIIASKAMIFGTFSIIQQSLALGCFPFYVPEINFIFMIACVAVTAGLKSTTKIVKAYGIAVVFVMTLTSALLVLIMIMIWKSHILFVISYVLIIGYLPLAFAVVLMIIMYIWNDVYRRKYYYELDHKISPQKLKEIVTGRNLVRMHGFPPIFKHYVTNIPALHSVVVFVSIKSLPISKIPVEERFLFRQVEHEEINQEPFEHLLVKRLKEFIGCGFLASQRVIEDGKTEEKINSGDKERVVQEVEAVEKAVRGGVVHLIGESEMVASKGAGIWKRILIDYAYNFLKKNLRQSDKVFDIPHKRMVKVGMTYEL